jgi:fructose-bisphosphate aldolase class 1
MMVVCSGNCPIVRNSDSNADCKGLIAAAEQHALTTKHTFTQININMCENRLMRVKFCYTMNSFRNLQVAAP